MFSEFLDLYFFLLILLPLLFATILLAYGIISFFIKDFMKSVRYFCLITSSIIYFIIGDIFYTKHKENKEFQNIYCSTYTIKDNRQIILSPDGTFNTNSSKISRSKGTWEVYHDDFEKGNMLNLYDDDKSFIGNYYIRHNNDSLIIESFDNKFQAIGVKNK